MKKTKRVPASREERLASYCRLRSTGDFYRDDGKHNWISTSCQCRFPKDFNATSFNGISRLKYVWKLRHDFA